ncbi:D-alanyl-D-alanine carboxypeptidase/D-alanyl-D-alanine-endopeptidase [Nocardia thailandica]|uniref:D-alanyl-D-alanine carboxypeptidase/D-alanyl-D-alanine-endopeptidase n=1 Tax=Nocardia thailandica TaxID=257275 RepID=UPI0002D411CF|nr:D-alanyl-D-alanine carboxypeptidase [Nocardia thailandica]
MDGGNGTNPGVLVTGRRRARWIWLGAALTVLLVAVAAVLVVVRPWTPEFRHGGLEIEAAPTPQRVDPQLDPAGPGAPTPSRAGVAAALAAVATSPDLGVFAARITDAASGTVLWSQTPDQAMIPSSTAKVMTTAAALLTLPAEHRLVTRVVAGSARGELVLVGGGDPTLTAAADGKGYFTDAPRLADLVAQIRSSGRTADTIVVDTSAYTGPTMAPGWDPVDIGDGSIAPMEPVMLDAGRLDPSQDYSPRTATPALDAGRRLASDLGLDPGRVRVGQAPAGATEVARVQSAPLRTRLHDMMIHSDNVLAEAVGRELAVLLGREASFAGATAAVTDTLRTAKFDVTGLVLADTSGLSVDDRVPPRLLDSILAVAAQPAGAATGGPTGTARPENDPRASTLAPMLDDLPVAGGTGTLAVRYVDRNRDGAGWVRAKTGTLTVASALVGYVLDRDGRVLTFALMSNERPPEVSRPALDAVATALRNCGCS